MSVKYHIRKYDEFAENGLQIVFQYEGDKTRIFLNCRSCVNTLLISIFVLQVLSRLIYEATKVTQKSHQETRKQIVLYNIWLVKSKNNPKLRKQIHNWS